MEGIFFQSLHGMPIMRLISLLIIVLELVLVLPISTSSTTAAAHDHQALLPQALLGCSDRCGNLTIPYPFGIAPGCYRSPEFFINCTTTHDDENPVPYLTKRSGSAYDLIQLRVTNISLEEGDMHVLQPVTRSCGEDQNDTDGVLLLPPPFTFSEDKNYLFAVGCGTIAVFQGSRPGQGLDGNTTLPHIYRYCVTYCDDNSDGNNTDPVINDDSCSGFACSLAQLPAGVQNLTVMLTPISNISRTRHRKWYAKYPCRYAFLVEQSKFTFSPGTSFEQLNNTNHLPVVVNWEIGGHGTCDAARKSKKDFACKGNSKCVDWPNDNIHGSTGYICKCKKGYQGNPYHPDGCQDIDECKSNPCPVGKCVNTPGSHSCLCPNGTKERSCKEKSKTLLMVMGISLILVLLVGSSSYICWGMKQRKYITLKEKYFRENGGLLLQQQLAHHGGEATRIFTAVELEKATNNYHDSRVLGRGAYGVVYKGILPDNRTVAIKRSKVAAPTQSEQFANELTVLSQINHKNVVRLLGCCLEAEVPLLVYEFITNDTLFEQLHGKQKKGSSFVWELRLKIAAETAGALAYLHSSTFMQIIHRDVKAMNILLDDNYTAKVSDFGASVLIPPDQTQIKTLVQGTFGYLDPEYLHSNQLTEKSDVYSFGVVLAELLTSKVAFSYDRSEAERSLARLFVCAMEEERLDHILDGDIVNERNIETVRNVAHLAKKCLMLKGEERPTMKEVAIELEGIMRTLANHHPRGKNVQLRPEDQTSNFLGSPSNASVAEFRSDCRNVGSDYAIAIAALSNQHTGVAAIFGFLCRPNMANSFL
ncbi:PREDICTED: wall-associated receptor kinase 1-like [Prunus mume]|uniref:Wall-associated receptor kinase 1-like n=1 Tax=Prunus mume TaxID=102107 RepID=A0ABM1LLA5_PRUMU|nr:PREDICTED: wall-associated receptor kinase 1-like [Prunus mume]